MNKQNNILFKDKLNFKYPGGAGFSPHIDGHFLWLDENNRYQKGWKKYSKDFINIVVPLENSSKKMDVYMCLRKETQIFWGKALIKLQKK